MSQLSPTALRDIQGFILSGYEHQHYAAYLFLEVRAPARARSWLDAVVPAVTTGERWPEDREGRKVKPPSSLNLGLSHSGLAAWGLSLDCLTSFPMEFIVGMAARARILGDSGESAPENWEIGGPDDPPLHLLLRLSAVDEAVLGERVAEQRRLIEHSDGGVVEVHYESGSRPADDKEPFGFRDGISNPLIEGTPGHPERGRFVVATGEFILGYLNGYDVYPPSPSVPAADDPQGILPRFADGALPNCRDLGANGSYLVYRKLEQDVPGFWRFAEENSRRPAGAVDHEEMIRIASKMVGRWPSGAPLVLAPNRDEPSLRHDNRFTYESDPQGFACPIGSHLRRANPRASLAKNTPEDSFKTANQHRILRRAASWGEPPGPFDRRGRDALEAGQPPVGLEDKRSRVGIHFNALNADIQGQFEMVQQTWCNAGSFNGLFDNRDPLVGDNDGSGNMTVQRSPVRQRLLHLPRFVHVRGGGYFFLPSVTALRYLASAPLAVAEAPPAGEAGQGDGSLLSTLKRKALGAFGLG
jgi:Dyp-type peroxidase family